MDSRIAARLLLVLAAAAAALPSAHALSWPLCEDGGQVCGVGPVAPGGWLAAVCEGW